MSYTRSGSALNEALLAAWADYIQANPGVTFVEMERIAERFIPVKGDQGLFLGLKGIEPGEESNVVMWSGVSREFCDHASELTCRGFAARPTQALIYFLDGSVPKWPIWRPGRRPANPKTIHWLPMAFSAVELLRAEGWKV